MSSFSIKDSFITMVVEQYLNDNEPQLSQTEVKEFVTYLVDFKIIPDEIIRIYTVLMGFSNMSEDFPDKNKTELIERFANQLNLKRNTITNILKDHKGRFTPT